MILKVIPCTMPLRRLGRLLATISIVRLPTSDHQINIMSVDVEDYFQVEAFADLIDRTRWHHYERRVERNTGRVLDLDEANVSGTFFICF